jgi:hypothetical protein
LEGEQCNEDDPVIVMWKEYRVARLFGWTPAEIDAAPSDWIDWALEIEKMGGRGA